MLFRWQYKSMKLNPQEIFNSSILKYRFDMSYIFKIKIWLNLNQMKFYLVKKNNEDLIQQIYVYLQYLMWWLDQIDLIVDTAPDYKCSKNQGLNSGLVSYVFSHPIISWSRHQWYEHIFHCICLWNKFIFTFNTCICNN